MVKKTRAEMITETRAKLLSAAREAFGTVGYVNTSMDDFTASVGLTRGAIYHHFGDKKGLLEAVVKEIDMEMDNKLGEVSNEAEGKWEGFVGRCRAYLTMALNPEIQRIVLRDAPAVLGNSYYQSSQSQCLTTMAEILQQLMKDSIIEKTDCEALARFINGGLVDLACWIANSEDAEMQLSKALHSLSLILDGLLLEKNA
ncbi:TetR family transcriptional regulator [Bacillus wiedmannii]|uniref:TetR/AcrR family transcriptional regulator n=1 Tax=Bacillus TaxID=1386 RepID=UPI00077AFEA1|nr:MULTISPECIES: TetR/AcrR family transcriptional regulator [Bacillus cereus group]KXY73147.1 TetR family transcriptional regulator [Bacillus wiedmannii]MCC2462552.1 TetR/AcrR family transcriptional regulator [Bacillus mobilis]MCU5432109.1 TetR/AcrR family transcriptional regulator [Bacillus mobilis]MCU5591915.1 TetR/AcrR family transcriptional regulator [Bacillus mobilis]MCU5735912.1 TetR/AcrR family transcriptional regulator [Bacillus mobilis]